jgi:hypothetical protein
MTMNAIGTWALGLAVGVGMTLASAETESYKFVKITDFGGEPEYKVVSTAEFKDLNDTIRMEARCIDKALAQAKDEWQKREKKAMPLGMPKARKVEIVFSSSNQETAQKELDKFLEKKEKREDSKSMREAEKSKSIKLTEKQKMDLERRAERQANESAALDLFKVKLESVVAAEKEKIAAKAAGAPAAPVAVKPAAEGL